MRWSAPLFLPEAYWSPPDGRRIWLQYSGRHQAHGLVFTGPFEKRRLPEVIRVYGMDWSPDGKLIAWTDGERVRRVHPDGTGLRTLLRFRGDGSCNGAEWSPDGRDLLLACAKARDTD